jgi:hypothetical protein
MPVAASICSSSSACCSSARLRPVSGLSRPLPPPAMGRWVAVRGRDGDHLALAFRLCFHVDGMRCCSRSSRVVGEPLPPPPPPPAGEAEAGRATGDVLEPLVGKALAGRIVAGRPPRRPPMSRSARGVFHSRIVVAARRRDKSRVLCFGPLIRVQNDCEMNGSGLVARAAVTAAPIYRYIYL